MKDLTQSTLNNNQKEGENKEEKNQFPNLIPRRGSLPADYNRPSPRTPKLFPRSPTTPNSPDKIHPFIFSPVLESFEEMGEILDNLLTKGKSSSTKILTTKLLEEKEREIERLEASKKILLDQEQEWEKEQLNHQQTQKKLTQQKQELIYLNNELAEIKHIFNKEIDKNDKLNRELNWERTKQRKQELKLEQAVAENYRLKVDREQLHHNLETKINQLTNLKRLAQGEKEQLQEVILEQQKQFEEKEQKQAKKYNNLRTFQIISSDNPSIPLGRGRPIHRHTYSSSSVPSSRGPSPYPFPPNDDIKPTSPSLFVELSNSDKKDKLRPTSLNNQIYEDLMNTVDNFANETTQKQENNQVLLSENEQLREKLIQSETAYQVLTEERTTLNRKMEEVLLTKEKLLQGFNEEKATWQNERQKLIEELAEMKYKFAESQTNQARDKKADRKAKYQLKGKLDNEIQEWQNISAELADELTQEKTKEQGLEKVEGAVNDLSNTIKDLSHKFKIEISPKK
jgi:hypothetical protein